MPSSEFFPAYQNDNKLDKEGQVGQDKPGRYADKHQVEGLQVQRLQQLLLLPPPDGGEGKDDGREAGGVHLQLLEAQQVAVGVRAEDEPGAAVLA